MKLKLLSLMLAFGLVMGAGVRAQDADDPLSSDDAQSAMNDQAGEPTWPSFDPVKIACGALKTVGKCKKCDTKDDVGPCFAGLKGPVLTGACSGACGARSCTNSTIQAACAKACCPDNKDKITNCLKAGKGIACPTPPPSDSQDDGQGDQ